MNVRREAVHPMRLEAGAVHEAPRRLPVRDDLDVLVCGGGPAGVGAALAAAREGARTMLVERYGLLGGMWTAGLLNPFFEAHGRGWVTAELIDRLAAAGAWRRWKFAHTFDVEVLARTLDAMLRETGVELLCYTLVVDAIVEHGRLRGVIVESKAGREAITARVVIDTTGDGDVAARAGCPYEYGREADGLVQPMTLMFEIRGVGEWEQTTAPSLYDALTEAIAAHSLGVELPFGRCGYVPWVIATPAPGVSAVQATHVYRLNPLDPRDLTLGTVETRRQVAELFEALRHVPGLEHIELTRTAATIGVRESRRVVGRYRLSLDDLAAGRRFPDAVTRCDFGVDIHEPAPGAGVPSAHGAKMRPYEIPYRALVPLEPDGLLVAGRCISGSHEAHASYRVTGTCMATGQAAGLAAAWAVRDGCAPGEVPGEALRDALVERGARLLDEGP